jgi:RNA polymerase sigma-70 factor (ECF subfamily)
VTRNAKVAYATGLSSAKADAELVPQLIAGDEEAFRTVVERYHGALIRLALSFVAERSAAEEVVQDTWLGVIKGIRAFEGRSSLKGWIFRILINRAKTRGVRDKRSVPFSSLGDPEYKEESAVDSSRFQPSGWWADPPERWDADSPVELLIRKENQGVLERSLTDLAPAQRTVVTLRDVEGFNAAEVCNILEISETNQRVLLHRGRSKIRQALERHFRTSNRDAHLQRTHGSHHRLHGG